MPVNNIFQSGKGIGATPEQNLVDDLASELIKITGHDIIYAPRTLVKEDKIFGEDVLSAFNKYWTIEAYVDSKDGYGTSDLLTKFGLDIPDVFDLTVARRRFEEITENYIPRPGDIIYFPVGKALFEIKYVEDESPFYSLSKQSQYKFKCELFTYSQETLNTGNQDVDNIQKTFENLNNTLNDAFAENTPIQEEGDVILDFDENNPFGEV